MKKWLLWIGIVSLAFVGLHAGDGYAETSFDKGYQSIAWGTVKKDLPDIGLSKKALKKIIKKGESAIMVLSGMTKLDMKYGDAPLNIIFLRFSDAVFYGVDLMFDPKDREKIYTRLVAEFNGEGKVSESGHTWETNGLMVNMDDRAVMVVRLDTIPLEKRGPDMGAEVENKPCCQ